MVSCAALVTLRELSIVLLALSAVALFILAIFVRADDSGSYGGDGGPLVRTWRSKALLLGVPAVILLASITSLLLLNRQLKLQDCKSAAK